jgi:hypothetical protein
MARYYFHLHYAHEEVRDEDGLERHNLREAENEARDAIRGIAAEDLRGRGTFELLGIQITDREGKLLSAICSREALLETIAPEIMSPGIASRLRPHF